MRFGSVLIVAGVASLVSVSAQAQTSYQTATPTGGYVYTGNQGATYAAPVYNTNARPLAVDQAIKGKNAPSYNFKGATQPYNFGTTNAKNGPMTVEEADQYRIMRDQQAAAYEKDLVAKINAQNANPGGQQGTGYNNLTGLLPGQQPQQPPRKKRLVYREDANPLRTPPRLFNPDQ